VVRLERAPKLAELVRDNTALLLELVQDVP
jgi:hypothetical protein